VVYHGLERQVEAHMRVIKNPYLGLGQTVRGTQMRVSKVFYDDDLTDRLVRDEFQTCLEDPGSFWLILNEDLVTIHRLGFHTEIQVDKTVHPHAFIRLEPKVERWLRDNKIYYRPMIFYDHCIRMSVQHFGKTKMTRINPITYQNDYRGDIVLSFQSRNDQLRFKLQW
jgi:hypothetical protein